MAFIVCGDVFLMFTGAAVLSEFHNNNQCMAFIVCGDVFLMFTGAAALALLSSVLCFMIISLLFKRI